MAGIFPPRFRTPAKKKVSSVVAEAEVSFYPEAGFYLPLSCAAPGLSNMKGRSAISVDVKLMAFCHC